MILTYENFNKVVVRQANINSFDRNTRVVRYVIYIQFRSLQSFVLALSNSSRTSKLGHCCCFSLNLLSISHTLLCNFIYSLFTNGYSPSSVASHVFAISNVHKLLGTTDQSTAFLVKMVIRGCNHIAPCNDLDYTLQVRHNTDWYKVSSLPLDVTNKEFF